jgi:hypothetical protein
MQVVDHLTDPKNPIRLSHTSKKVPVNAPHSASDYVRARPRSHLDTDSPPLSSGHYLRQRGLPSRMCRSKRGSGGSQASAAATTDRQVRQRRLSGRMRWAQWRRRDQEVLRAGIVPRRTWQWP